MSIVKHTASLLVIDGAADRHETYRKLLSDLIVDVEVATPEAASADVERSGHAGVVVHIDGLDPSLRDQALACAARAAAGTPPAPILVVASDVAPVRDLLCRGTGTVDYLPDSILPDLLRCKVAAMLDLEQTRRALAQCEATVAAHARQVGEQVHRTKNLLAIMQSIAMRTITEGRDVAAARDMLVGRLRALSRSYQLLIAAGREGADMSDIVDNEVGAVSDRVTTSGPSIRIGGSAVQTLALALHELIDNAQRHGAFRTDDGRVAIGWTYFERGEDRYLEIAWSERGLPVPLGAAPQYGFGLSLVSSLAGSAPSPNVRFEGGGLECCMRLGRDALAAS